MIHELEINEVADQYLAEQISTNHAVKFIDYIEDNLGTNDPESVYDAFDALYCVVMSHVSYAMNPHNYKQRR